MALPPDTLPLDARESTFSDLEPLEMVYSHMPRWLLDAPPDIIQALNGAMAQSRLWHGRVGRQFSQLQSIEAYCAPLLAAEVLHEFGPSLDIHHDYLLVVHVHLMTDDTLLATIRHYTVNDEPKTLLWAALQNFSEAEAQPGGFNPQSRILHGNHGVHARAVKPHEFAALCRRLDLGLKYQRYLQDFLGVAATGAPAPSAAQTATESGLRQLKSFDMQVDAHIALLKKKISDSAHQALLALLAVPDGTQPATAVTLDGKPVLLSSLSLLDTRIDGLVVFSADALLLHPGQRLIVYIPNDPGSAFFEFGSLQIFIDELKHRLRDPEYVRFFCRFIALSERPAFMHKVNGRPESLFLTAAPLGMSAAHYLTSVQLRNMFADAQVMAVPTGVLDERRREERWQLFKTAGLLLVNVAALFVPGLGEMMLAVAIGQMLQEVYEGVEDWAQGDVDHAREHLLNVGRDIAVNATVAVGIGLAGKAVSRLGQATRQHFEDFTPVRRDDGSVRLWNRQLKHYARPEAGALKHTADARGIFSHQGTDHVEVAGEVYGVTFDDRIKQWRITHPKRPTAFAPALLHNGQGSWQHAHELPLEWQGSATLVGRLGGAATSFDAQTLENIRALTDTAPGLLRRVHADNLAIPPLLNLSLKRFDIDRQLSAFVEQMNSLDFNAARWSELQLQLLPTLPQWPVGKGVVVVDRTGRSLRHYGSPLWPVMTRINLTTGVLEQGKLLEAVVTALTEAENRALLGSEAEVSGGAGQALARRLGDYVRDNRSLVFDRLYAMFDVSTSLEAIPLERAFPGLARSLAQELVETANASQSALLRSHKVPIELAEKARIYVREARINRAIEGFYLDARANEDTERLALHFLQRLPGYAPADSFEIREGSLLGPVIHQWGNVEAWGTRVLVKTDQGYTLYRPRGGIHVREPGAPLPLLEALFASIRPQDRAAMAITPASDGAPFNAALASLAAQSRLETAQVLGIQPVRPRFRPPVRLSNARIGYPLCGLREGEHSRALQRRVRDLYPEFTDEQVQNYLGALIAQEIEPLQVLRARKRERGALSRCLQDWISGRSPETASLSDLYDHDDERYQVARLIHRGWRRNPAHLPWADPEEVYTLNLDGFRVMGYPTLPAMVDLSHIRELKMNNCNIRSEPSDFLQHFTGLMSLEMDNNNMTHLPSQLENMPNLRRLSVARNHLFMNAANVALLNRLSKLEVLNLNHNLLGLPLNLDHLSHLRRVYLRHTLIDQWPQGLISRPLLESADLRDNRISEIPDNVFLADPGVTRNINLAGNPLSAATGLRLARYTMQGGSSMGINNQELMSEAAAFEFWTAGLTGQEVRRRELLWSSLRADVAADDFFAVLSRLTTTADAQAVRQDLSRRIWEMIEALADDGILRRDVLDIAASPRSCSDSVAFTFSVMELQLALAAISQDASLQANDLLNMALGQFRLNKLSKIATDVYEQRVALGKPADELEIHLAYRIGLSQVLDLPAQPRHMAFSRLADISEQDLELARIEVESAEVTPELNEFISTQQFWKDYLMRTHKAEYKALVKPFYASLGALLNDSPQMNDERYLRRVSEIRSEMDAAVDAWSLRHTNAELARQSAATAETSVSISNP